MVTTARAREIAEDRDDVHAFVSFTSEDADRSVAVKDMIDVAGMVTTCGAPGPWTVASSDAPAIARIRSAGYGVVGKTNMHEWSCGITSDNRTFGRVLNPRDVDRLPGGSSGGSAAAVAMGACDWALGSDTGGSIRIPAAFCGVVGFKPTYGVLSNEGTHGVSSTLDTLGPLARDIDTVRRAFAALTTGADSAPDVKPSGLRLCTPGGWVVDVDAPIRDVWDAIRGHTTEIDLPEQSDFSQVQQVIVRFESSRLHEAHLASAPEDFDEDVFAFLTSGLFIKWDEYRAALARRMQLSAAVSAALADFDAILLPTAPCIAPLRSEFLPQQMGRVNQFTRPFNVTGHPAVTVPVPDSMVALQLVGRLDEDWALLDVATELTDLVSRILPTPHDR